MRVLENPEPRDTAEAMAFDRIARALRGIRYGSIEITVHDGRVVQIERKEKLRWERPDGAAPG